MEPTPQTLNPQAASRKAKAAGAIVNPAAGAVIRNRAKKAYGGKSRGEGHKKDGFKKDGFKKDGFKKSDGFKKGGEGFKGKRKANDGFGGKHKKG